MLLYANAREFAVTRELKKRERPRNNDSTRNLIGAALYRRRAQVRVLQVTRPSLPGGSARLDSYSACSDGWGLGTRLMKSITECKTLGVSQKHYPK